MKLNVRGNSTNTGQRTLNEYMRQSQSILSKDFLVSISILHRVKTVEISSSYINDPAIVVKSANLSPGVT